MLIKGKHLALFAAILAGVGAQLSGLQSWGQIFASPAVTAGFLTTVAAAITAVFVDSPKSK